MFFLGAASSSAPKKDFLNRNLLKSFFCFHCCPERAKMDSNMLFIFTISKYLSSHRLTGFFLPLCEATAH